MRSRRALRGQTAVLFTLMMVPLFGVTGLVIDIGWAYYRKEAAQTAADAAASAAADAAYTASAGAAPTCGTTGVACYSSEYTCPTTITTPTNNIQRGCMYASDNGFSSTGRQKVTFTSGVGSAPTAAGATVAYWVSVKVSERIPQLFSSVLGFPNALVTARTTTGTRVASSGGCVITLNPTASGAISMNGTTNLTTGCGVFDNSSAADAINIVGGGNITTIGTAKTDIVGQWSGSGVISPAPRMNQPHMDDPFLDMAPPTYSGCSNTGINLGSHSSQSLPGGSSTTVICGDINLSSQSTLTLGAGLYVVTGTISLGGQTSIFGSGVTIYLPNGGVSMAGGASVSLSAPSSGTWQGILFYQKRGNATQSTLVGGTNQQMNGVLYFPSANLTYTGGSGTTATATTIVADTLTLNGNSFINASAVTSFTGTTGGVAMIE
jgi:Flp pilus assembly protein TadG